MLQSFDAVVNLKKNGEKKESLVCYYSIKAFFFYSAGGKNVGSG